VIIVADVPKTTVLILLILTILVSVLGVVTVFQASIGHVPEKTSDVNAQAVSEAPNDITIQESSANIKFEIVSNK